MPHEVRGGPAKYLAPAGSSPAPVVAKGAIYTCPVHPEIRLEGPGSCPICGMALESLQASLEAAPNLELLDMQRRFWTGMVLALSVFVLEMGGHVENLGLHRLISPTASTWVQLALSTPVVVALAMALELGVGHRQRSAPAGSPVMTSPVQDQQYSCTRRRYIELGQLFRRPRVRLDRVDHSRCALAEGFTVTDIVFARVAHVLGVVLWIGGVGMVTTVLLPAIRRSYPPEERFRVFHGMEARFAWQAQLITLITRIRGFYMTWRLDAWDKFQTSEF
jgi:hypothetical protein